jgi:predicted dehydrogenase
VRTFKVVGEGGIAQVDLIRNHLLIYNAQGDIVEQSDGKDFKRNDMFLAQMKQFLSSVAGQTKPMVNLWDGTQSLRLALAAKESMTSQSVVFLKQGLIQ